ncbi:hypothetical protein GCM10012285_43670 [Streptomyces kronopolitis]|uniref:Uncharacterized protein n=1 Tax=Streptomyces kronopolitis TaxID=1612435 RepID=A0ABQ2JTN8_9ACTN|nr:hypothetical protein GCM10012285_43670 [Streptomyces kronopolitis]
MPFGCDLGYSKCCDAGYSRPAGKQFTRQYGDEFRDRRHSFPPRAAAPRTGTWPNPAPPPPRPP